MSAGGRVSSSRAWPSPAARALFGKSLRCPGHWDSRKAWTHPSATRWGATPTHLAWGWQIQRWELQGQWVLWDSIPDLDRDSLAFAYIRLRRDTGAVQTHSPGGIVLSGCLALGTEALDSYKDLAGKLFDSFDSVLESPLLGREGPASAAPDRECSYSFGYQDPLVRRRGMCLCLHGEGVPRDAGEPAGWVWLGF